jgi:outer membrane protein assembly factor BamA
LIRSGLNFWPVDVFAYWPFSANLRLEGGAAVAHYSYRIDQYDNWYDGMGQLFAQDRRKLDKPDAFNLYKLSTALVGDHSHFGLASPMSGYRFRLGVDQYIGKWDYKNILLDGRRYFWAKPVSFAFRALHFARIGKDAVNFYPFYIGDPLLVRGYGYKLDRLLLYDLNYEQLSGNKLAVVNAEIRLPFSGPKRLAILPSGKLFTELALFLDGGAAWSDWDDFKNRYDEELVRPKHEIIFSTGLSMRINLFNTMILEPYYAVPLQKEIKGAFGINLMSLGW